MIFFGTTGLSLSRSVNVACNGSRTSKVEPEQIEKVALVGPLQKKSPTCKQMGD